jgi:hypothetical protein
MRPLSIRRALCAAACLALFGAQGAFAQEPSAPPASAPAEASAPPSAPPAPQEKDKEDKSGDAAAPDAAQPGAAAASAVVATVSAKADAQDVGLFCPGAFWGKPWGAALANGASCWGAWPKTAPLSQALSAAQDLLRAEQDQFGSVGSKPSALPGGQPALPERGSAELRAKERAASEALARAVPADPRAPAGLRAATLLAEAELSGDSAAERRVAGSQLGQARALMESGFAARREDPSFWPVVCEIARARVSLVEPDARDPATRQKALAALDQAQAELDRLFAWKGQAPRAVQAQAQWAFEEERLSWDFHPTAGLSEADQSAAFERAMRALTLWKLALGSEETFWGAGSPQAPDHAPLTQAERDIAALLILRLSWLALPQAERPLAAQCSYGWQDGSACVQALADTLAASRSLRSQLGAGSPDAAPDASGDDDDAPSDQSWLKPRAGIRRGLMGSVFPLTGKTARMSGNVVNSNASN